MGLPKMKFHCPKCWSAALNEHLGMSAHWRCEECGFTGNKWHFGPLVAPPGSVLIYEEKPEPALTGITMLEEIGIGVINGMAIRAPEGCLVVHEEEVI